MNARVLRFGGGSQTEPPTLWQWTAAAGWSEVATAGSFIPYGRTNAGFVFDSQRNRMLLIGGTRWDGTAENDVWALSLTGTPTWSPIAYAGTPVAKVNFSVIYDPIRDRVIRVGGSAGGPPNSELWQLSLSGTPTWTVVPEGGLSLVRHVAIYDPVRDRMIVHGGTSVGPISGVTWALALSGTPTWTQISAPGAPAVFDAAAVYDPLRDRMVVLGGTQAGGNTDQTRFLSFETQPFWSALPAEGVTLGARNALAAAYDPDDDLILASGGGIGGKDTRRLDCAGGWWLMTAASNGTVQVTPSKVCFSPGEQVTLIGSPSGGMRFDHWLDDASGNANPLDLTMDGNKAIYAQMVVRTTTDVGDSPVDFALRVSPNPTAGPVSIEYALPREDHVRVSVFDVGGRELARLVDGSRPAGRFSAGWNAGPRVAAGLYLVRYDTSSHSATRRVAVIH